MQKDRRIKIKSNPFYLILFLFLFLFSGQMHALTTCDSSEIKVVRVENNSKCSNNVKITGCSIEGANANMFRVVSCPTGTIPANSYRNVQVAKNCSVVQNADSGAYSATLKISRLVSGRIDNIYVPLTMKINGAVPVEEPAIAGQLVATPNYIDFGYVKQGESSGTQKITLKNTGENVVTNIQVSPQFPFLLQNNTCNTTLNANQSCFFDVSVNTFTNVGEYKKNININYKTGINKSLSLPVGVKIFSKSPNPKDTPIYSKISYSSTNYISNTNYDFGNKPYDSEKSVNWLVCAYNSNANTGLQLDFNHISISSTTLTPSEILNYFGLEYAPYQNYPACSASKNLGPGQCCGLKFFAKGGSNIQAGKVDVTFKIPTVDVVNNGTLSGTVYVTNEKPNIPVDSCSTDPQKCCADWMGSGWFNALQQLGVYSPGQGTEMYFNISDIINYLNGLSAGKPQYVALMFGTDDPYGMVSWVNTNVTEKLIITDNYFVAQKYKNEPNTKVEYNSNNYTDDTIDCSAQQCKQRHLFGCYVQEKSEVISDSYASYCILTYPKQEIITGQEFEMNGYDYAHMSNNSEACTNTACGNGMGRPYVDGNGAIDGIWYHIYKTTLQQKQAQGYNKIGMLLIEGGDVASTYVIKGCAPY